MKDEFNITQPVGGVPKNIPFSTLGPNTFAPLNRLLNIFVLFMACGEFSALPARIEEYFPASIKIKNIFGIRSWTNIVEI